jgi:undecaprenyl-phosphate galactose phosphotransferase
MAPRDEANLKQHLAYEAPLEVSGIDEAEATITHLLHEIETTPEQIADLPHAHPSHNLLRFFIASDIAALTAGFFVAWLLSAAINVGLFGRTNLIVPSANYVVLAVQFGGVSFGVILWFLRTNHYLVRMPFWMETKKVVEATGLAMLVNCFLQVVSKQDFSRVWLLSAWLIAMAGIILLRTLVRKTLQLLNLWSIPTILVGNGITAQETRAVLVDEDSLGYNVVAQVKDLAVALKQSTASWVSLCKAHKAAHVIIALDGEDFAHARLSLAQLAREHVPFSVVPPTHNLSVVGMTPQSFLGQDVMLMTRNHGLDYALSRYFKRAFDIVVSATALLMLSPVILTLALIVKLDGGEAFYRHKRIGYNGNVFSCLKLRSMMINSDAVLTNYLANNPQAKAEWLKDHKLRKDPRVTLIGAFMRRTSLDELPQLYNVLRGDMSIVGPRPIIVAETKKYDSDIAFYYRVRPGITGLWQVSGRNDVTYGERVRMDSWYVRNWSMWHDIAIMFKTVGVVLKGRGAY